MMAHEANVKASKNIGSYLDMTSNIERIGDHAVNICDYTKLIEEKQIVFSDSAKQQMKEMKMICEKMFHNISKEPDDTQAWLQKVHDSENLLIRRQKSSMKVIWNVSIKENVTTRHVLFSQRC